MIEVYAKNGKTRLNLRKMSPKSIRTVINYMEKDKKKATMLVFHESCSK